MFIILLRFGDNRAQADQFMERHNAWIKQGLDDGIFLLVGGLQPNQGGGILAWETSRDALQARNDTDPFVAEGVVSAEILEIAPAMADPRLQFLCG